MGEVLKGNEKTKKPQKHKAKYRDREYIKQYLFEGIYEAVIQLYPLNQNKKY